MPVPSGSPLPTGPRCPGATSRLLRSHALVRWVVYLYYRVLARKAGVGYEQVRCHVGADAA